MKYSNNGVSIIAVILVALMSHLGVVMSQYDHGRASKTATSIYSPSGVS